MRKIPAGTQSNPHWQAVGDAADLEQALAAHKDPQVLRSLYMGYVAAKAVQRLRGLLGSIRRRRARPRQEATQRGAEPVDSAARADSATRSAAAPRREIEFEAASATRSCR